MADQVPPRVTAVDDAGVHLAPGEDTVVDVLFDGRRIWSFWTVRDTVDGVAAWPPMLRKYLTGTAEVSVVEHLTGTVAYDGEVTLGSGGGRIAVVDAQGRPLGLDKSNRIVTTFDTRDPEHTKPLLDSTEQLLDALREAGVDAFPAYGTLLGAVREQDFIGHDSDVDLGYVSRETHPLDVVRESFRLQRFLKERGYAVDRYSAAAFKVDVVEADGTVRGLDVFGGFFLDGRLYLMGEIGTPFELDWIFPLGTCTLAGRTLPAPARPEKLLEATYGPGWQVPDPAFHFETPRTTNRRLNGWFRGMRVFRNEWDARYSGRARGRVPGGGPSRLAQFVREQEEHIDLLVDVGAGQGGDALWFARDGVPTMTLDYAHGASSGVRRVAEQEGLDLDTSWVNLHELRSVLAQGSRIALRQGHVVLMANHLVDSTDPRGLRALVRLARMSLAGRGTPGRLYLELDVLGPGEHYRPSGRRDIVRPKDLGRVEAALTSGGAVIVHSTETEVRRGSGKPERPVARLVAEWQR
ncbi:MAG: Methyltransferase type 11 [Marmoricola sp.]|nr:Methyltransferase type 11 [Marmoricola sp.]